jgi:hypothetical protein
MNALSAKQLVGKTITDVNDRACNVRIVTFSDGSQMEIEAEPMVSTAAGTIYGPVLYPKRD